MATLRIGLVQRMTQSDQAANLVVIERLVGEAAARSGSALMLPSLA
jgi:hypothetical protein